MHAMGGSDCRLINARAFFLGALLLVQESWAGNVLEFVDTNDRILEFEDDSSPGHRRINVNGVSERNLGVAR